MTKRYNLCGIGNAIVDILIKISEEEFAPLDFVKGTMNLVEPEEQGMLLKRFANHKPILASGGSVANSIIACAQLGGQTAFSGCIADDKYGTFYDKEFKELNIKFTNNPIANSVTGTCAVLITPDSERTMRTCLGISSSLGEKEIDHDVIAQSEWIFAEGYLFANPENGQKAISSAIDSARQKGCKVALTFSDSWVIDLNYDFVNSAVDKADLVFANEVEAKHFTKSNDRDEAFKVISERVPNFIMTAGAEGAYLSYQGEKYHIPAFDCQPVDLTGAGDIFAGAFLYGITNGIDPVSATRGSCYLASKVISQIGARLHSGARQYWDECLGQSTKVSQL